MYMNMSEIVPMPLKDVSKSLGDDTVRLMVRAGLVRKVSADSLLYMPLSIKVIRKIINRILKYYCSAHEVMHGGLDEKRSISFFKVLKNEMDLYQIAFYSLCGDELTVYFKEENSGVYLPEFIREYVQKVENSAVYVSTNETGHMRFLSCPECGRLYDPHNIEISMEAGIPDSATDMMEIYTPGATTIDKLCKCLDIIPEMTVKTMIYETERQKEKYYYAVMVRGDRTISEEKLKKALEADRVGLADESVAKSITGSPPGFCGPVGINVPIIADLEVSHMDKMVAGANKLDTHIVGCTPGRDFQVERYFDLRCGTEGDKCPVCSCGLRTVKGYVVMQKDEPYEGVCSFTYHLGRILQSIVKNGVDEYGIRWPRGLAPFDVAIEVTSPGNKFLVDEANSIKRLLERDFDVLYDDRDMGLRARLVDIDLLGIPKTVIVTDKTNEIGRYELRYRRGESKFVERDRLLEILNSRGLQ